MPNRIRNAKCAKNPGVQAVKDSALYVKIVEWSDEDQCFIGQCPGIIGPRCHGDDETQVSAELCDIVEEWIAIMKQDGQPIPPPTIGKNVAEKLLEMAS
jgi:predicted RNase H-like HicB family nuclease